MAAPHNNDQVRAKAPAEQDEFCTPPSWLERAFYVACMLVTYGISTAVVAGALGWVWVHHGQALMQAFWAVLGLLG